MEFRYPATEVYNSVGGYRVAWSVEEYERLLFEGWLAEKPVISTEEDEPEPPVLGIASITGKPIAAPKPRKQAKAGERGEAVVQSTDPESA